MPPRMPAAFVATVRDWEQGKRLPRGPARALLHAPELALRALVEDLREHPGQAVQGLSGSTSRGS